MISPDALFMNAKLVLSDAAGRTTEFEVVSFSMNEWSIYADGSCEIKARGYLQEAYPQTIDGEIVRAKPVQKALSERSGL